jgi:hypothetical protein
MTLFVRYMPDMYAGLVFSTHSYAQTCRLVPDLAHPQPLDMVQVDDTVKIQFDEATMSWFASLEPLFVNVATKCGTTRNRGFASTIQS